MSRQLPVTEIMTTDVLTFAPEDNVGTAMRTLVARGIDGAPVVTAEGEVVGMLSTSDLIVQESELHFPVIISILGANLELPGAKKHFDEDFRKALGSTVAEVMHADPITVDPTDTVEVAATLLHDHDISRLPVVGDAGLVGLVARLDILKAILREGDEQAAGSGVE